MSRDDLRAAVALQWATRFHETYERLAPSFGYETRPDTKAFDPDTPNGRLMIAVCGEVVTAALTAARPVIERQTERKVVDAMRGVACDRVIDAFLRGWSDRLDREAAAIRGEPT